MSHLSCALEPQWKPFLYESAARKRASRCREGYLVLLSALLSMDEHHEVVHAEALVVPEEERVHDYDLSLDSGSAQGQHGG